MRDNGSWIIGTPDDCIESLNRLAEQSGGYGGFLVQTIDWAPREKMLHSFELMARFVMPHFQGSIRSVAASNRWAAERQELLVRGRVQAIDRAHQIYADRQGPGSGQNAPPRTVPVRRARPRLKKRFQNRTPIRAAMTTGFSVPRPARRPR